jgi:hypothetical protein
MSHLTNRAIVKSCHTFGQGKFKSKKNHDNLESFEIVDASFASERQKTLSNLVSRRRLQCSISSQLPLYLVLHLSFTTPASNCIGCHIIVFEASKAERNHASGSR